MSRRGENSRTNYRRHHQHRAGKEADFLLVSFQSSSAQRVDPRELSS